MEVLRTGDIVEIKGAYFKNDNGLWCVKLSPGDPGWGGSYYSLSRVCKNGKFSKGAYNLSSWPLISTVNNRDKRAEAKAWNERNATIKVRTDIDNRYVAEYFREEAENAYRSYNYFKMSYGEDGMFVAKKKELADFLFEVAERLEDVEV